MNKIIHYGAEKSIIYEKKIFIVNPKENMKNLTNQKITKYFLFLFISLILFLISIFYTSYIIWKKNKNKAIEKNLTNIIVGKMILETAEKAHNFVYNSDKGVLINPIPFPTNNIPKISVVIPVYNCETTILRAIRSVENQNFSDFEIILVNDFSIDNTSEIIKDLQKEDFRIKIINNKKNMGILYTRCIGTLFSQGRYIFPLDNDDLFLDEDVIDIIYNEINNNNYDIIYFKGISVYHFHDFLYKRNLMKFRSFTRNEILRQPELGDYAIKRFVLWAQCIKSELYKKAINSYGEKRYSKYVTFFEDAIINYINNQFAEKAELFLQFGILHMDKSFTAAKRINHINKNIYEMYYIETIFEYSRNTTEAKEIVVKKIINLINFPDFNKSLNDKDAKIFFISLIKKILASEYIDNKDKELIKEKIMKNK